MEREDWSRGGLRLKERTDLKSKVPVRNRKEKLGAGGPGKRGLFDLLLCGKGAGEDCEHRLEIPGV